MTEYIIICLFAFLGSGLTFFSGFGLGTILVPRANLTKVEFIATGIVIAVLIDISRLIIYLGDILKVGDEINTSLLISASLAAFTGAFAGSRILKNLPLQQFKSSWV